MSRASPLKLVASAVVIALGLAGCGGGDSDVSDVSEADVVEALNLRAADPSDASDPDPEYVTADGRCRVYQILIGEDEVAVYAEAGGNVATNGDGTLGARVNPASTDASDADCLNAVSAALDEGF